MNKVSLNSFLVEKSSLKTKFQQYSWVSDIYLNSRNFFSQSVHQVLVFRQVIKFSIYVVYDYQNNYTYSSYVSMSWILLIIYNYLSPSSRYFMLLNKNIVILDWDLFVSTLAKLRLIGLADHHLFAYLERKNTFQFLYHIKMLL